MTFLLRLRPAPSPPASRRRKSSFGSSRPVSGSGWDVVVERQGGTPPPPQRRTSVGSRPPSGTAWDMTSQPSVAPSAPPTVEVHTPWVCPTPQRAWSAPYGPLFPNVNWTQPFATPSQLGLDYRHLGLSTIIPQPLSFQEDYRHHFEPPRMFFQPVSVDTTSFQVSNNLPVHHQPLSPTHEYNLHSNTSKDVSQRQTSPGLGTDGTRSLLHKKSYSVDNENPRGSQSNLASLKSISLSHGNLSTANNQNISSNDCFPPIKQEVAAVVKGIRSSTPKEPNTNEQILAHCENNRFVNSFRRYSLPPNTLMRASSMDQLQPCGVPEGRESPKYTVETKPPALPPRPPNPARFCKDERRRSQQMHQEGKLQETTKWVSKKNILLL